eukprot:5096304-Pleurochrysis_carterae.AAC.1
MDADGSEMDKDAGEETKDEQDARVQQLLLDANAFDLSRYHVAGMERMSYARRDLARLCPSPTLHTSLHRLIAIIAASLPSPLQINLLLLVGKLPEVPRALQPGNPRRRAGCLMAPLSLGAPKKPQECRVVSHKKVRAGGSNYSHSSQSNISQSGLQQASRRVAVSPDATRVALAGYAPKFA